VSRQTIPAVALALAATLAAPPLHADHPDHVEAALARILPPGLTPDGIASGPMEGVYEVVIQGRTVYAMVDGDRALIGEVYDLEQGRSMSSIRQSAKARELIDKIPLDEMVVFGNGRSKAHITVFTDVNCSYCRRLHQDVPGLVESGLEVRYIAFPRRGIDSPDYTDLVSVWCADDQQEAMNTAKSGGEVEQKDCDNPVADHYRIGVEVGVSGTPTIILADGTVLAGYRPPSDLLSEAGVE
jgi:thiol:disulfide interchange protein DsbC